MDTKPAHRRLSMPAPIRFGDATMTPAVKAFRRELSLEIIGLLRSLPSVLHTDAAVFCIQHLGASILPAFDYFRPYHAPAWSTLYWIRHRPSALPLTPAFWAHAKTAHAMALFLHPLDDHLNDGQLPANHLNLLLRSQAWMLMNAALTPLAAAVPEGVAIVEGLLADYYASIGTEPPQPSLDGYCDHFRHQMATWLIVPLLLARECHPGVEAAAALEKAYTAFGTAWRLLDDLQDIKFDRFVGSTSAVYFCLPKHLRPEWPRPGEGEASPHRPDRVGKYIVDHAVVNTIRARAASAMAEAVAIAAAQGMAGLALELQALARPLAEGHGRS